MSESKGQPVASSTTLVHKSDIDKAMPRNRAFAKVISTRTGPRLLDLPPEIRLMIFRHLLVLPIHLSHWMWSGNPFPNLGLMRTCKSIHKEAFDVLYKENLFDRWFWSRPCTLTRFPRVVDTIQDIEIKMYLREKPSEFTTDWRRFVELMHFFGHTSIIRRKLVVDLYVEHPRALKWAVGALGGFTNFRTLVLFLGFRPYNDFPKWCEYFKTALEPVLGPAEQYEVGGDDGSRGLRFHPVDHQIHLRESHDGDCDYFDGIRPGWNENLTDTNDSGSPTQEQKRKHGNYFILNWTSAFRF